MNQRYPEAHTYWPASYSFLCMGAALVAVLLITGFFGVQALPPEWMMVNIGVLSLFFILLNIVSVRSEPTGDESYAGKLFWMALIARVVAVFALVSLAELTWDRPFYVGAVDETRYHRVATEVAQIITDGNFSLIIPHLLHEYMGLFDNIGVPLILGPVYALFGNSVIVGKLFFALMGTGTVVLVYKTTRLIWDESVARLAGILMAFFPLALFYSSVILKEEFVAFLVMLGIYILVKGVINNRLGFWDIVLLLFAMSFIFLFRTAAGALLVTLVAGTFVFNRFGGSKVFSLFTVGAVFLIFYYFMDMFVELDQYFDRITGVDEYSEARVRNVARGNVLATIVGTPVYVVLSFVAPFPSMVQTSLRFDVTHDATYYWVSGLMIWNFLAYFGIIGLWKAFTGKFSESLPVWGFAAGYSVILGITALFTVVRFNYNAMPLFIILIAVGIKYRHEFPYWKLWLPCAVVLIVAWNFFRLAGRGAL